MSVAISPQGLSALEHGLRVFREWKLDGIWRRIHEVLRDAVRKAAGKKVSPTAGIIDSQSIRTAEGGESLGFDDRKKITWRKRHILVDSLGMLLRVVVHGADVQDYEGGATVLDSIRDLYRRLKTVFADGVYGKEGRPSHVKNEERIQLQAVLRHAHAKGIQILTKRWIVERTFAWITRRRRLCNDYERQVVTSETMVYIAMIELMSRRLANQS